MRLLCLRSASNESLGFVSTGLEGSAGLTGLVGSTGLVDSTG